MLKLAQLRGKTTLTNEATLLALLVCWALQQQEAQQARQVLMQAVQLVAVPSPCGGQDEPQPGTAQGAREGPLSSWGLTALCVQTLRVVVQGYWTPARLRLCLPQLRRFVRGSPRQRTQQESTIRCLLAAHYGQMEAGSSLVFFCSSA